MDQKKVKNKKSRCEWIAEEAEVALEAYYSILTKSILSTKESRVLT